MSVGLHCRVVGRPGRAAALDAVSRLHRTARAGLGADAAADRRSIGTPIWRISPTTPSTSDRRESDAENAFRFQHLQQGRFRRGAGEYLRIFAVDRRTGRRAAAVRRRQRAVRRDEGGGRSRARRIAAGADQGASRSRQQDPARGGPHRGIQRRAEQRRPRSAFGCRISRRSSASTTPIAAKFGFPYIVCVRRHTRDSILRDFERRLPNDAKAETQTSIEEICRIAALRLDQLVASDDKLAGARPPVDPCAGYPQRQAGGRDRGRTDRTVRSWRKPAWWRARSPTATAAPISR